MDAGALYLEPTFDPERTMPPGNGMMTSGTALIALTAASAAASVACALAAHDQQISAADRVLRQAGGRFADKFAVHDRHTPIVFAAKALGDLPAVPEEPQRAAELERLFALEPGVAGGARGREHALPDAVLQLLLQFTGGNRKQQRAHPGPAVRRLARR